MNRPLVWLLDAREAGVDEDGLRRLARARGRSRRHSTRSYRFPYALVAAHDQAVGVDLERIEPHDRAFAESIATPEEIGELDEVSGWERFVSSLWSSKEALAKALGDAVDYDPRRLESPMRWREGRSGPWRCEELSVPAGHVAWLCWRSCT